MAAADPVSPLTMLAAVIGSLMLAWGLGALLLGGRGVATPPDWWGRLDDPVPEPSPAPVLAGVGGGSYSSEPLAPPAPSHAFDSGPGPVHPENHGPGAAFSAIVLERAGKWGNYWQEIGRCQHRHRTEAAAFDCALAEPPAGSEGRILAVGAAE